MDGYPRKPYRVLVGGGVMLDLISFGAAILLVAALVMGAMT